MSTKTTFKRVALVAVAALGLGVLSVVPSQAAVSGTTLTVTNGTSSLTAGAASDSRTAATVSVSGLVDNGGDSITVGFVLKSVSSTGTSAAAALARMMYLETSTSTNSRVSKTLGAHTAAATFDGTSDSVTVAADRFAVNSPSASYIGAKFIVQMDSGTAKAAGVYTYTAIVKSYSTGAYTTPVTTTADFTITIAAAAADSTTPAAATSFARLGTTQPTEDGTDAVLTSVATAGTATGFLTVGVRNATGTNNAVAVDSVTVTLSGPGLLCRSSVCGKSFVVAATGDVNFSIQADGTAGVATIAVKTNTVTFANKSVTFYAKGAKTITAKVDVPVLAIGANADAIEADAVDANGTRWSGAAYIVASTAADALVAGSATTPVLCSFSTTDLVHYCPVTAVAAGTAKFKIIDASTVAAATATSNEVTVTVSAEKPASVKLAFDKASYAPFEKATITVTPVDAAGKPIAAQTLAALLATGGITSTYAFSAGSDTLTATTFSTSALTGAKAYTVYMPAASGDVVITATGGTALAPAGQVKVTATATVVNPSVDAATDAANEATDAANAATDAALAAADAADAATAAAQDASDAVAALSASVSKLISSLRAQITSLTNLVIKIQKKVRA
jgi:trimeric autotransporter adhesin